MMASSYTRAVNSDISKSIGSRLDLSAEKLIFLTTVDFIFTQTVINAFSTASWRGVWNILDIVFAGDGGIWQVILIFHLEYLRHCIYG